MSNKGIYKDWLRYVFDHTVDKDNEWYWEDDCEEWGGPSESIVDYLIKLFENPITYLSPYSDEQIDQE